MRESQVNGSSTNYTATVDVEVTPSIKSLKPLSDENNQIAKEILAVLNDLRSWEPSDMPTTERPESTAIIENINDTQKELRRTLQDITIGLNAVIGK